MGRECVLEDARLWEIGARAGLPLQTTGRLMLDEQPDEVLVVEYHMGPGAQQSAYRLSDIVAEIALRQAAEGAA